FDDQGVRLAVQPDGLGQRDKIFPRTPLVHLPQQRGESGLLQFGDERVLPSGQQLRMDTILEAFAAVRGRNARLYIDVLRQPALHSLRQTDRQCFTSSSSSPRVTCVYGPSRQARACLAG